MITQLDGPCTHGWIMPPECPECLRIERDHLSEMLRRNESQRRYYKGRIERLHEILDEIYDLIVLHHSDDLMKTGICPVCTAPENDQLWKALSQNRQDQNQIRKERGEKPPF